MTDEGFTVSEPEVKPLANGDQAAMDALIERCKTEKGAAFEADVLADLRLVYKNHRSTYETLRGRMKKEAGVRVASLSELIERTDKEEKPENLSGQVIEYPEVEPWDKPVDGEALLTDLSKTIGTYVKMQPHQLCAVSLWIMRTHSHDWWDHSAILHPKSVTKRCGKTRLLEVIERLAAKPQMVSGITSAALNRIIDKYHPTMLIDEFDAISGGDHQMAEALRGLLNSSFNRSAYVVKNVPTSEGGYEPRKFSVWAPIVVAGIGKVPDTVADRCIDIELKRKLKSEKVHRLRAKDGAELNALARKIVRWTIDNEVALRSREPEPLNELNDRMADAWEPLLIIAEVAGSECTQTARNAARTLAGAAALEAEEQEVKMMLLADIRDIYAYQFPKGHPQHEDQYGPRLVTDEILKQLCKLQERPWREWGRKQLPMNSMNLASQLREFSIRPGTVRATVNDKPTILKGYYLRAFEDAFARYLDPPKPEKDEAPEADGPSPDPDEPPF